MKEKISAKLLELKEGKNLTNVSEKTIKDYAAAISATVTDESQINEDFISMHKSILTSMNGQLYADNTTAINEFKSNYKPTDQAQSTETQTEQTQSDGDNATIAAMQSQINDMIKERAEEKAAQQRQNLIDGIKSKCDEKLRSRFSIFVDGSKVDFAADVNTNYSALYSKFEAITKPDVDEGSVGVPNGNGNNSIDTMFDGYKPEPK